MINKGLSILLLLSLFACSSPSQRFHQFATDAGLQSQQIKTSFFTHQLYYQLADFDSQTLHIYLDGDGTPWKHHRWIAKDPTARNPLIIRLMKQDPYPSILIGRPCYYGLHKAPLCDSKFWTSHRYSNVVVESMGNAIQQWLENQPFKSVVLIGYSGGGALALLMAKYIEQLDKVVTVASNVNVSAWSKHHGYLPLTDSLNPANADNPVPTHVKQIHIAGAEDKIVPAFIIKQYARKQVNTLLIEFPEQDHACCWEKVWPTVLQRIDKFNMDSAM